MNKLLLLLTLCIAVGCNHKNDLHPHITIETSEGDIEVELYPDKAPVWVANFLKYVDSGYYTNSSFYRVLLNEGASAATNAGLIQGGTWMTTDKDHPPVPGIKHESTKETGLTHSSGTMSLARTGVGTAGSEFFICIGDMTQLDYGNNSPADGQGFAAFGSVVKGMSVVRQIQVQPKQGEHFVKKIIIRKIERS